MKHYDKWGRQIKYDPVGRCWLPLDDLRQRMAERAEKTFQRLKNSQEKSEVLYAPNVISDCQGGVKGIQSMQNGVYYDSKSKMRAHYEAAGVIEIGNDSSVTPEGIANHRQPRARLKSQSEKDKSRQEILDVCKKAASQVNLTAPKIRDQIPIS